METVRDLIEVRAEDENVAMVLEDSSWTYREYVAGCRARAAVMARHRGDGPFHIGVLLDNGPEYAMLLGAAALAGAAVVGINPTRRGAELRRDVAHTDCCVLMTESAHTELLSDAELSADFVVDGPGWHEALAAAGEPARATIDPSAPYLLLFTSGTTGDPKAAVCSQARLAAIGTIVAQTQDLTAADVCYLAMPMFHSNALMAGWGPCLAAGATAAFRRRFSASGFLPDVRRYGVTYFNYVGKPLTYILATPPAPDDGDNTLRRVFGNEAAPHDLERFSRRFDVDVLDAYGSTEGGVSIVRTPDTPAHALGRGDPSVQILDPATCERCPPAVFDATGRLANADRAIGEIVSVAGSGPFEGYWRNPEADQERIRAGIFWSGDLGYMDEGGMIWFAGRNLDWLRVDGENFAAAPVERILVRHADVELVAVYAVPNSDVGDDVMAAVVARDGAVFDPEEFATFLAAQPDMGSKWLPRYVRWTRSLPQTATNKIVKRLLRAERWDADDVWVREGSTYRELDDQDRVAITEAFAARGRSAVLEQ